MPQFPPSSPHILPPRLSFPTPIVHPGGIGGFQGGGLRRGVAGPWGGGGGGVGRGPHAAGRPHPIGPSAWERGRNRLDRLGGVTASAPPRVEEEEEEEGPGGVPVGSPWGGHAAVRHGGLRDPTRVRGVGAGRGRDGGVYVPPPKTISSLPSPRSRVGHTTGGSRGASPTSARVPLPRGPLRSHGVGPSPTPPPPHSPNRVAPTPHIHARPPPPPTPRSVHSVPFVPTVPHTRRLGTLHGVDTRGRGDPRTRTHGRS